MTDIARAAVQLVREVNGRFGRAIIADALHGAKVDGVDDLNQTFELLLSGRIDATLNAEVVYYDYKKVHPQAAVKIACVDETINSVGIPLKKEGTEKLQAELNKILADLRQSGELTKLSIQFFGTDISKK